MPKKATRFETGEAFKFVYLRCEGGIIDFEILRPDHVPLEMYFMNTFDNLDEYILWMESILDGAEGAKFQHDPESLPFIFEYSNGKLAIYDWQEEVTRFRARFAVDRTELCVELYGSFRRFIESPAYDKLEWEEYTCDDFLIDRFGSVDAGFEALSRMEWGDIIRFFNQNRAHEEEYQQAVAGGTADWYSPPAGYETWDASKRKAYLTAEFGANSGFGYESGLQLSKLRSDKLEALLKT